MCALCISNRSEILQPQRAFQFLAGSDDGFVLPTNDVFVESSEFKKKLSHNAHERQRRKKLNALYATLGSLLPHANTKKKLSIPAIVNGVLKYIPKLMNQIENLATKRDKLLATRKVSEAPSESNSEQHLGQSSGNLFDVRVNVSPVAKMEVVVTVESPPLLFSDLLVLFKQENLDVLNASTFVSHGFVWHTIQLKVMESSSSDLGVLRSKILLSCQKNLRGLGLQHRVFN